MGTLHFSKVVKFSQASHFGLSTAQYLKKYSILKQLLNNSYYRWF